MGSMSGSQHGNKISDTKTISPKNVDFDINNRMCGRLQTASERVITDPEIKTTSPNSKHISITIG